MLKFYFFTILCLLYVSILAVTRENHLPTRSNINWTVQQQKMAKGLKFQIWKYRDCENKGADELRSYCAADLCTCFCICQKQVFSWHITYYMGIFVICVFSSPEPKNQMWACRIGLKPVSVSISVCLHFSIMKIFETITSYWDCVK